MTVHSIDRLAALRSRAALIALATIGMVSSGAKAQPGNDPSDLIRIHRHAIPDSARQYHGTLFEGRPPLRGFRASILRSPAGMTGTAVFDTWPMQNSDASLAEACERVEKRLARDGLLWTTAQAMEILGPSKLEPKRAAELLRNTGLPVDWLAFFKPPGERATVVEYLAHRFSEGAQARDLQAELARIPFQFKASRAGFAIATESGEHDIGALRLQLTSGTYWSGAGDGGCLDMVRQLVEALPRASFIASLEEKHVEAFLATAAAWPLANPGQFTLIPEPFPLAQWAQDNGKPGIAPSTSGAASEVVTLMPRYASRGEDGTVFVPGETYAIDGFASAGQSVVQSPVLFQGGNLMAVRDPKRGERILLAGEAEIHRNVALGLTPDQVLQALRIELAVDRVVVFVNDSLSAARIVLECGVNALEAHKDLDARAAGAARDFLEAGRFGDFMAMFSPVLLAQAPEFGRFPESFSKVFSVGDADSGVGNLHRLLLAMDLVTSRSIDDIDALGMDPYAASYLRSFERREVDRAKLIQVLEELGWKIVPVPSFSDDDRGINYLNGIHERARYWMPAYGGLYQPLDEAARRVFEQALGPEVKVLPIATAESQRRAGALHCSISVMPRL